MTVQLTDKAGNTTSQLTAPHSGERPVQPKNLFDTPEFWRLSPDLAFASWLESESVVNATRKVRSAMWGKFLRYLSMQHITLDQCDAAHIASFLVHTGQKKEQAWRYIKLIERIYVHLNSIGINTINPARCAAVKTGNPHRNDPMHFLTHDERNKLTTHLLATLHAGEHTWRAHQEKPLGKNDYTALRIAVRDAAVCALLLGAGVKVSELIRLKTQNVSQTGVLEVPRSGFDMNRQIDLLPVAIEGIRVWMCFRQSVKDMGLILFPAMVAKRRDDQQHPSSAMHPATVFRRVKAILGAVGISEARACGQTLRNTFAAGLIDAGASDQDIIDTMGFSGNHNDDGSRKKHFNITIPRLRHEHAVFFGLSDWTE